MSGFNKSLSKVNIENITKDMLVAFDGDIGNIVYIDRENEIVGIVWSRWPNVELYYLPHCNALYV